MSQRLSEFWIPDETVLYIGKATHLKKRLGQFYRNDIGSKKDTHRGGHWLKTLGILEQLYVYFASTENINPRPEEVEQALLQAFSDRISAKSRNPARIGRTVGTTELFPMPFANREMNSGGKKRKDHGIKGRRINHKKKKT